VSGGGQCPELCDRHWGYEQLGTHMGAGQQGAVRSGGQPGSGEVRRTADWRAIGHTRGG
jgi:hypothetical protein